MIVAITAIHTYQNPDATVDELAGDETMKQILVLMNLYIVAIKTKDEELIKKLKKKRQDLCAQMMTKIDDIRDIITDNQYLELCNLVKDCY